MSDVATAVFEGADAVMLSAESAAGEYPVEAVETMNRIAEAVEQDKLFTAIIQAQRPEPESTGADTIASAARQIGETLGLAAIVCYTSSGSTGIRASRERPSVPVIALSPVRRTARRLSIVWGLHCVVTEDARNIDEMVDRACAIALQRGLRAARPARHHHRRRSVRDAGRDQPAAHRVHRPGRHVGNLDRAQALAGPLAISAPRTGHRPSLGSRAIRPQGRTAGAVPAIVESVRQWLSALSGFLLQLVERLPHLVELRIDLKRPAVDADRLRVAVHRLQDHAEARERAEMARLQAPASGGCRRASRQ